MVLVGLYREYTGFWQKMDNYHMVFPVYLRHMFSYFS